MGWGGKKRERRRDGEMERLGDAERGRTVISDQ
jgi:hypothetical protein